MHKLNQLRRSLASILLAVAMQVYASAPTRAADVITLAIGEWKPFISESLPGNGPALEIVSRAFELEGITVNYVFRPWKRAMEMTAKGKFDGTPGWVFSDERAARFHYSDSIFSQKDMIFFNRDNVIDFKSAEDFSGMRTRILLGSYVGDEFAQLADRGQLTVNESKTYEHMFKMLLNNRTDFLYLGELVGTSLMNKDLTKSQLEQIVVKDSFREPHQYYLLVSKQDPEGLKTLKAFNSGLKKLKALGEYGRTMDKVYQVD